jgi:RNA polymerase sigma-70 factor (ECF subfamily)
LDRLARESTRTNRQRDADALQRGREIDSMEHLEDRWTSGIEDDRLRLIFTCCHPQLDLDSRIALTLRSVAWLSTEEIASAFGVPVATMAQRLVRAKAKIKSAGLPYRVPSGGELPDRLAGVLRVVYLVFNEAYLSARPATPIRVDLADEAIRLGRQLAELMPDEPEVFGLLALMLGQHARAAARFDADGELVLMENQDRARWDRSAIDEAETLLSGAMRRRSIGPYQLQAAIAATHNGAAAWSETDWRQIADLYGVLAGIEPSPVVALNRAVAIGFADGFAAGLDALDMIDPTRMPQRHLYHAARAEMLAGLDRREAAAQEFARALEHVSGNVERRHLERRLSAVTL